MIREARGRRIASSPSASGPLAWIDVYLSTSVRAHRTAHDGWLFVAYHGSPSTRLLASSSTATSRPRGSASTAGCHLFRPHGDLDARGVSEPTSDTSRRCSLQADDNQIYTQVAINKLKQIHTATHPAALLKPLRLLLKPRHTRRPPPP